MAQLAKNPIRTHEIGKPCMLGEVVGRLVGAAEDCEWAYIDKIKVPSIVLFGSPHGTIIKTGRLFVSEMTDVGTINLEKYEAELIEGGKEMYAGKLKDLFKTEPEKQM